MNGGLLVTTVGGGRFGRVVGDPVVEGGVVVPDGGDAVVLGADGVGPPGGLVAGGVARLVVAGGTGLCAERGSQPLVADPALPASGVVAAALTDPAAGATVSLAGGTTVGGARVVPGEVVGDTSTSAAVWFWWLVPFPPPPSAMAAPTVATTTTTPAATKARLLTRLRNASASARAVGSGWRTTAVAPVELSTTAPPFDATPVRDQTEVPGWALGSAWPLADAEAEPIIDAVASVDAAAGITAGSTDPSAHDFRSTPRCSSGKSGS
ncbi:MAG: hypothetical protein M3256_08005 [Actinomycetota bacterium]|nr:hypothetical protein [Actinomycetota bacterium]